MGKIGERLLNERLKMNITQAEIANSLNVTKQTISNWENDKRTPDSEMLLKLADFYKISVDYLLGRTDIPTAYVTTTYKDGSETIIKLDDEIFPHGISYAELNSKLELIINFEKKSRKII